MLPECCTTEAKAYSINFKHCLQQAEVSALGGDEEGHKWLFLEWKQTVLPQKHICSPWSDSSFPPQEGIKWASEQSQKEKKVEEWGAKC